VQGVRAGIAAKDRNGAYELAIGRRLAGDWPAIGGDWWRLVAMGVQREAVPFDILWG